MKTIVATLALVAFVTNFAAADIIVLRDGIEITGTIWDPDKVREDPQSLDVVRIQTRGNLVPIEASRISYLVFGDSEWTGEKIYFHNAPTPDPQSELVSASSDSMPPFECYALGKADGSSISTSGSFAGGLFGGFLLPVFGVFIAVVAQSEPQPPRASLLALGTDECRYAYSEAFTDKGKSKKRSTALIGGLVGTAIFITLFIVWTASSEGGSFAGMQ